MKAFILRLLIAVSTFFLSVYIFSWFQSGSPKTPKPEKQETSLKKVLVNGENTENKTTYQKVICTCRIGAEEIPAVQIAEVKDSKKNVLGIVAHVYQPREVHFMVEGAVPEYDYQALSAESGNESIKLIYRPQKKKKGFDWILLLKGKEMNFQQTLKDCGAVSDE